MKTRKRAMTRVVEADSVEDYLNRYYKKSRMSSGLVESYQEEFEARGYVCTSHHDNTLGEFIAWPYYPGNNLEKYPNFLIRK